MRIFLNKVKIATILAKHKTYHCFIVCVHMAVEETSKTAKQMVSYLF